MPRSLFVAGVMASVAILASVVDAASVEGVFEPYFEYQTDTGTFIFGIIINSLRGALGKLEP
ncbi:hypothetical protein BG000_008878 [Podila horticola]|nr:hypothetical protein BG000_008878 [Podila horticola]